MTYYSNYSRLLLLIVGFMICTSTAAAGQPMLAAGEGFIVALKENGTVWGWGYNWSGAVGSSNFQTDTRVLAPVKIQGIENVISISAGEYHVVALKSDGTVWVWGSNEYGQFGNGTKTTSSATPSQVEGMSQVISIAAGSRHTLALKSDGTVWGWGVNNYGQSGCADDQECLTPQRIGTLNGITAISAGGYHSASLKSDGTVWSWGSYDVGAVGTDDINSSTQCYSSRCGPIQAKGLDNVVSISAGAYWTIALRSDGSVWAWGWNTYGQLGNGAAPNYSHVPVQIISLSNISSISTSSQAYHNLAKSSSGLVFGWGGKTSWAGSYGFCGNSNSQSNIPVSVQTLDGFNDIYVGSEITAALDSDGYVWTCGIQYEAQVTNNSQRSDLRRVPDSSGYDHFNLLRNEATANTPIQSSSVDCLFNWAEEHYSSFFSPAGVTAKTLGDFYYRFYSDTNSYLATNSIDNHMYYFGSITGNSITDLGAISGWLSQAGCPDMSRDPS